MPNGTELPDAGAQLYLDAVRRAALRQMEIGDLINVATTLNGLGQRQRAVDIYKTWIAHNPDHPLLYAVYFNYSVSLSDLGDVAGSVIALRETVRLKDDFCPPYINLGSALERLGQVDLAIAEWLRLINMFPMVTGDSVMHKTLALKQIGRVLETRGSDKEAEDLLRQSLDIDVEQLDVIQHYISLRQRQCKWPVATGWGRVTGRKLMEGISPLSIACHADDPMFQLANAYNYNKRSVGIPSAAEMMPRFNPADAPRRDRLRIGYVSSDLREHAVGFAMTDVLETHDHSRFEIFAYYCGIKTTDGIMARSQAAADHWVDISEMDDGQAAARIAADGIDILVDLNGYTKDARTRVFARRPAPINVNWFGFPSTMGSPYHHYVIVDDYIVPPAHEVYFSEKVLRLPCYQPNDRKRLISPRKPTRQEAGLPEKGMVYCCLNGMQKLTSATFGRWLTILRAVPGSVIWMFKGTDDTNARLKQLAAEGGVAPERVIFADKMRNPDHLARFALADLFLDTLPYGAHTSASDAMWMGVPVLTLPGRSFASRVCGSLVRAAGTPELVCQSPEDYVNKAIELGQNRAKLTELKTRLAANRHSAVLFDTPGLIARLEDLYRQMWDEYRAGGLPVPDLRNMDVYHEIGAGEDLASFETLSDDAYRALYHQRLSDRDRAFPIPPDARFWTGS